MIDRSNPVFVEPENVKLRFPPDGSYKGVKEVVLIGAEWFVEHHTSTVYGYTSRKSNAGGGRWFYPYAGRFGRGFVTFTPHEKTTYSNVTYFLHED